MHYSTSGPRQSADHVKTASIFLHASSKKKLKKYTALDSSTESPRSLEAIEMVMLWYWHVAVSDLNKQFLPSRFHSRPATADSEMNVDRLPHPAET